LREGVAKLSEANPREGLGRSGVPSPPRRSDCHEVAHRLCWFVPSCLDADDGMLLPSLVLSAPLLQPMLHLLLLCSRPRLSLQWPLSRQRSPSAVGIFLSDPPARPIQSSRAVRVGSAEASSARN